MLEHIILDLDSTLIYSKRYEKQIKGDFYLKDHKKHIWIRPGFKEFIEFLFINYKTISVWSVGTKDWLQSILPHLFGDKYYKLTFILDRSHADVDYRDSYFKNMKKRIFKSDIGEILNMNASNTILIDDNILNYNKNKDNCITIKQYKPLINTDAEFINIINKLQNWKSTVNQKSEFRKKYRHIQPRKLICKKHIKIKHIDNM
jgi:hypothetical protein